MDVTAFVCEVHVWNKKRNDKPIAFVGSDQCKKALSVCKLFPELVFSIIVREDDRIVKNPIFVIPENVSRGEAYWFFSQLPAGEYERNFSGTRVSEKYGIIKRIDIKNSDGLSFSVWCPPCLTELLVFCEENNIQGDHKFIKS